VWIVVCCVLVGAMRCTYSAGVLARLSSTLSDVGAYSRLVNIERLEFR
jgi:hypothetical protein